MSVLGTRIERAVDDDRARTVLVSDLHIPDYGGDAAECFFRLIARATAAQSTRVVVLGDLFDAYVGPKMLRVGIWRETAMVLADAASRGLSVTVLHGNRDFMFDAEFAAAASCRVVAGGLDATLGDRRAVLLHGDELCQNDLPYQRAKRWLRHPWTCAFLRRLPLRTGLRMAARARARSRQVIGRGDPTRFDPTAAALREVFAAGFALLVFGHIHRAARGAFPGGGEYAILPAFDDDGVHLIHERGVLEYRDAVGRTLPDFPARHFA
ncbi:MAG: UDP-2,3-diacylglucosamine diphosphatase [Planctomycetes bacterium]|nr:UDP-2,3-diacylglucosamine diphosphatase [Planctomycetota bacterium]